MSLTQIFQTAISAICSIDCSLTYDVDTSILLGNGTSLSLDVFFHDNNFTAGHILQNFLDNHSKSFTGTHSIIQDKSSCKTYRVESITSKSVAVESGFYIINYRETERILIFNGYQQDETHDVDYSNFPEVIFALCMLNPKFEVSNPINWKNIFATLGPFAIFPTEQIPYAALACYGIFVESETSSTNLFSNILPESLVNIKSPIPIEAERVFAEALASSDSPDIVFIQLYRVFELLFALGIKKRYVIAQENEILSIVQEFKNLTEVSMLKTLFSHYPLDISLNLFTPLNFQALFAQRIPTRQIYEPIRQWLVSPTRRAGTPPYELAALLIYYMRCSLVHGKIGDNEPFIIRPFSSSQLSALNNLLLDTICIIKVLIFE